MSVTRSAPSSLTGGSPSTSRPWAAVTITLVGAILNLLDSLVTVIAGPSIMRDLGGSQTFIQWLSIGYTVAMAAGLLIGGRLGDRYGRKRMYLAGMAGFTAASLVSALAVSQETLITARVVQGLMGALMLPQALGIIREVFPPHQVGIAFGLTGPVMALAGVAGPVLAGWLVEADYFGWGWRMIFAVNIPIGLAALGSGVLLLPRSRPQHGLTIDVGGAALTAGGTANMVFALVEGREFGWPWWVFTVLLVGVAGIVGFIRLQYHRGSAGRSTLVVPSLFSKRAFVAGMAVGLLFFGAMMGGAVVFSLFLQLGLGFTPFRSALVTLAQAAGVTVGFGLSRVLGLSRRTMLLGFTAVAIAQTAAILAITIPSDMVDGWWLAPPLALMGIGMGLAIAPFFDIVLAGVAGPETSSASGSLTAVQQVGNALGVSVLGSIFFGSVDRHQGVGILGFSQGLCWALGLAVVFVVSSALVTLLLPERAEHAPETVPRVIG